jgi:DNA-binding protein HU-beta
MAMQKIGYLQGKRRSQPPPESFKACYALVSQGLNKRGGPNMAKKAATPTTVTLKHLAAGISEGHELSKKSAEAILTDLVGMITKHLKKGERIRIVGLGILQVRKRAARMGRNPATGEAIQIKASKKVAFRAAKELKEAV